MPVEVRMPLASRESRGEGDFGVAVVDFGSSRTYIRAMTALGLGLREAAFEDVITGSGQVRLPSYFARLRFPTLDWDVDPITVPAIRTLQSVRTDPPQPVMALLGRDLLLECRFEWNGPAGTWALHYP